MVFYYYASQTYVTCNMHTFRGDIVILVWILFIGFIFNYHYYKH